MGTANLMVHAGGRYVERDELLMVPCPEPTRTWKPVDHFTVATSVIHLMQMGGYGIKREKWALSGPGNERMFGVLDMECDLNGRDITLAVGVRNSVDKTFPLGFCAGNRVFVCDNLAFSAELMVKKKHMKNGFSNFTVSISKAVASLEGFVQAEKARIQRWQGTKISRLQRDHVILKALESDVFPKTLMVDVFREQVNPQYAEFRDGTAFGLFNNFTTAMRPRAVRLPHEHSMATQKLTSIIEDVVFDLRPDQYRITTPSATETLSE